MSFLGTVGNLLLWGVLGLRPTKEGLGTNPNPRTPPPSTPRTEHNDLQRPDCPQTLLSRLACSRTLCAHAGWCHNTLWSVTGERYGSWAVPQIPGSPLGLGTMVSCSSWETKAAPLSFPIKTLQATSSHSPGLLQLS